MKSAQKRMGVTATSSRPPSLWFGDSSATPAAAAGRGGGLRQGRAETSAGMSHDMARNAETRATAAVALSTMMASGAVFG
jgi:hypothetical protein